MDGSLVCAIIRHMEQLRETLVAELRERGVTYLAPSDAVATETIASDEALLVALLEQPDARLHLALIPLLIRHADLAGCVVSLVNQVEPKLVIELQTLYMAAVYLQRLWKTRLGFYLDTTAQLPDLFSQQLGLPSAEERFGKTGLYDLADAWQARSRYPFDRLAALNNTMDLFFEQLKLEQSIAGTAMNDYAPTG
jgi:hypothetical protein